jgi:hypothetical protein
MILMFCKDLERIFGQSLLNPAGLSFFILFGSFLKTTEQ